MGRAKANSWSRLLRAGLGFAVYSSSVLLESSAVEAATVTGRSGLFDGRPLIIMDGELVPGDEKAFVSKLLKIEGDPVVVLNSPGGSLQVGIEIGQAIRLKGLTTLVQDGSTCPSACAFGWLGGAVRIMQAGAKVGFHAAYELKEGVPRERGAANAILGAYLGSLGLPQRAIYFVTESPPESMTWLTYELAEEVGIQVKALPVIAEQEPVIAEQEPREPVSPASPATPGLARLLQEELKRVGCYYGVVDGIWGLQSMQALDRFMILSTGRPYFGNSILEAIPIVEAERTPICLEGDRRRNRTHYVVTPEMQKRKEMLRRSVEPRH